MLSSPDSDGTRAAHPSRWLLEVAGRCAGEPLDTVNFNAATENDYPWLRLVRSAEHGVRRLGTPADLEDRRLYQVVTWRGDGFDLAAHPIARRPDLPLGPGLRAMLARRSTRLTAFDGNLGEEAGRIAGLAAAGVISASAVETWAGCPFKYFLSRLLKVEPTERPEDAWAIDPLERGSLIHRVAEQFFRTRQAAGRLADIEYTADDVTLIEQIARGELDAAGERGVGGHPLVWENTREAIGADLHGLLAADQDWRRERQVIPAHFEQPFGVAKPTAWPALVASAAGTELRFRGFIDRIDVDPAGRRAFVFDYKTGKSDGYKQLSVNPTLDGQHVQIALYARAARANLGDGFVVGGGYWFITSRGDFKLCPMRDDQEEVDRELDRVLEVVATGIREGIFPQVADETEAASARCRYCEYARVCPPPGEGSLGHKQDDPAVGRYRALQFQSRSSAE